MGHANNIITAPVDVVGDLAYLFGVDSGDLGTIIEAAIDNDLINLLSFRKCTDYTGADSNPNVQPYGEDGQRCGINMTAVTIGKSQHAVGSWAKVGNTDYSANTTLWSLLTVHRYRALDFDGYVPKGSTAYEHTGTVKPFEAHLHPYTASGGNYYVDMMLRYQPWLMFVPGGGKLMGVEQLFGSADKYFGFFACARSSETTTRSNDLTFAYIGSKKLGDFDSFTASEECLMEQVALTNIVGNPMGGLDNNFLNVEPIHFVPFIAIDAPGNYWRIFTFNYDYAESMISRLAYGVVATPAHFRIKYTIFKENNKSIYFYIDQATDFEFWTYSSGDMYFARKPICMCAAPDGTDEYFSKESYITFGTQQQDGRWLYNNANFNANAIIGWSNSSDIKTRPGTIHVIRKSGTSPLSYITIRAFLACDGVAYKSGVPFKLDADVRIEDIVTGNTVTLEE